MTYPRKLGVFAKNPEPGTVKTRLIELVTAEGAARIYAACLSDLLGRLARLKKTAVTVFVDGGAKSGITQIIPSSCDARPQATGTLGARLEAAFDHLLAETGHRAVMLGSDSPDLPLRVVKRAFNKLKHVDVVLGPATDGGYYLIGLRRPAPALFAGIDWSSDRVFTQTVSAIQRAGLSYSLLPLWYDVDTADDIRLLRDLCHARRGQRGERLPELERVLSELGIMDE